MTIGGKDAVAVKVVEQDELFRQRMVMGVTNRPKTTRLGSLFACARSPKT